MSEPSEEVALLTDIEISNGPSGKAVCTVKGCTSKKEYSDIRNHCKQHHNLLAFVQFPEGSTQTLARCKTGYFRCPRCDSVAFTTGLLQKHTRSCDAPLPPSKNLPTPSDSNPASPPVNTALLIDASGRPPTATATPVSTTSPPLASTGKVPEPKAAQDLKIGGSDLSQEGPKQDHRDGLRHAIHRLQSSPTKKDVRYAPYSPSKPTPEPPKKHRVPYPLSLHPSSLVQQLAPGSVSAQQNNAGPSLPPFRSDPSLNIDKTSILRPSAFFALSCINSASTSSGPSNQHESLTDKEKLTSPVTSDPNLTDDPMEGMELMYPSSDEELEEYVRRRVPSPKPAYSPIRAYKPLISPTSPLSPVSPISSMVPRMPVLSTAGTSTQIPLTPPPERPAFNPFAKRKPPPVSVMSNVRHQHQLPSPVPSPQGAVHPVHHNRPERSVAQQSLQQFAWPVPQAPPSFQLHTAGVHFGQSVQHTPLASGSVPVLPGTTTMPGWSTRNLRMSKELYPLFERPLTRFGITGAADIDILCTWQPEFHWAILRDWLGKNGQVSAIHWISFRNALQARRKQLEASDQPSPPALHIRRLRQSGVPSMQIFQQAMRRPLGEHAKILGQCGIQGGKQLDIIAATCEDWDMLKKDLTDRGMSEFSWLLVLDGFKRWKMTFFPIPSLRASQ